MFVDTAKPQGPASSCLFREKFRPALRGNDAYLKDHRSAQYFHGITADADIGNAFPFPLRSNMHFAWATALHTLPNHDLLITIRDSVLHHPTGSAACRRSCGGVFTAVKKHSSSNFELAFAAFGAEKVEQVRASLPQKLRCLAITKR